MAKFIAISGPSASGKSSIWNTLKLSEELSGAIFVPDIFKTVWDGLVEKGLFFEYEEVNKDSELLCIFIQRVIDHYKECIEKYASSDSLVIIDGCWLDLNIYATINMWYTHVLKEVQEGILHQLANYDKSLSMIYITSYDEELNKTEKYRSPFKRYNIKYNRPLEIQYYELFSNLENAEPIPTSDVNEASIYILEDLMDLGYL